MPLPLPPEGFFHIAAGAPGRLLYLPEALDRLSVSAHQGRAILGLECYLAQPLRLGQGIPQATGLGPGC